MFLIDVYRDMQQLKTRFNHTFINNTPQDRNTALQVLILNDLQAIMSC